MTRSDRFVAAETSGIAQLCNRAGTKIDMVTTERSLTARVVMLRSLAASGLAISAIGASLDFLSAYQMVYDTDGMMTMSTNQFLLGAGLSLLGLVVALTGLAIALPRTGGRMGLLGLLMEIYGVLMVLAGACAPGMNVTVVDGMFGVGVAMFLHGLLMQWRRKGRAM